MTALKEDMIYTMWAKPSWSQIFKIKVYLWFFGCFDLKSSLYTLLLVAVVFHAFRFFGKVGSWGDKFFNSWIFWCEHKTIFNLIYVNFFDKICSLKIIYMSSRWKIGKHFAQKMIINTKTDRNSCQGYQKIKNQKWSNDLYNISDSLTIH